MIIDDKLIITWTLAGEKAPWANHVRLSMISGISPLKLYTVMRDEPAKVYIFTVWVHGGPQAGFTCCSEKSASESLEEQKARMEALHREVLRAVAAV